MLAAFSAVLALISDVIRDWMRLLRNPFRPWQIVFEDDPFAEPLDVVGPWN